MDFEQFYSITTTTLVVLSSATLVIFQFLLTDIDKKIHQLNNQVEKLISLKYNSIGDSNIAINITIDNLRNKFISNYYLYLCLFIFYIKIYH